MMVPGLHPDYVPPCCDCFNPATFGCSDARMRCGPCSADYVLSQAEPTPSDDVVTFANAAIAGLDRSATP